MALVTLINVSSCKKEPLPRPTNDNTVKGNDAKVEDTLWVLAKGRVYLENLDNGETHVYDYFNDSITAAQMHIFGGSSVKMDNIEQNITTWEFKEGYFTLNGADSWEYTEYNGVYIPYGLTGGTSRPIQPTHVTDDYMTVIVHEAYGSDGVNNYRYFSELTFVPSGGFCYSCQPALPYGWEYKGVWSPVSLNTTTLEGTKWVVTRYDQGLTPYYPNDTLHFVSQTKYTINGSTFRSCSLTNVAGNNMLSLNLYSFTTLGGDYSGLVQNTFIGDWAINNAAFADIFTTADTVFVWMERIE